MAGREHRRCPARRGARRRSPATVHRHPDGRCSWSSSIGSIFYALYISVWKWNIRSGPVEFLGLDNYADRARRPDLPDGRPELASTTRVVWVPLTMVLGLFLAVIVNQKLRGQTFFRAAFYFPAIASSAAITMLWIFIVAPDGLFNDVRARAGPQPAVRALRHRAEPELDRRPGHRA